MPVLISDALAESRAMLNDIAATKYTNAVLLPYIRKAYEEFQSWADNYNLQTVKRSTTFSPGATTNGNYQIVAYLGLGTTPVLASDIRIPIRLWEKTNGDSDAEYTLMEEREFKPTYDTTAGSRTTFGFWSFDGSTLYFPIVLPASGRTVKIDYLGSTVAFTDQTSSVYDIFFKTNLAARTAALAAMYIGQNETRAAACNDDANQALDRMVSVLIRQQQGFAGTRRIPFGTRRRYREAVYKFR